MFTRCPECHTAFRINIGQLRENEGEVECTRCHTVFNALPSLAMTAKGAQARGDATEQGPRENVVMDELEAVNLPDPDDVWPESAAAEPPAEAPRRRAKPAAVSAAAPAGDEQAAAEEEEDDGFSVGRALLYGLGSLAFATLLGFQIFAFESQTLSQSDLIRPLLNRACETLGCDLPPFRDVDRIKIMDRALNAAESARPSLDFSMIFSNESSLPQAFPKLKLILNDVRGQAVAERVFEPSEYLPDWREGAEMPVGRRIEVRLRLVKPEREISDFAVYPL